MGRTQASLVKRLVVCDERQIAGHHRQAVPDTVECITFCRVIISYAVNLLGEISEIVFRLRLDQLIETVDDDSINHFNRADGAYG